MVVVAHLHFMYSIESISNKLFLRYAQSLVMGAYSYAQDPGNEYLLITSKTGWEILTQFWSLSPQELYKQWDEVIKEYNDDNVDYLSSSLSQ